MQDVITKYTPQYDGRSLEDLAADHPSTWGYYAEDYYSRERLQTAWIRFQKENKITDIDRLVMEEVLGEMKPEEPAA